MKKELIFLGILFASTLILTSIASADTLTIRPNAQGDYSEWANSGCSSGSSEWECVSENISDIQDNLYTNSKNKYESFVFQDTGLTDEIINSITLYFHGQRYNPARYQFQPLVRSNGINYIGSLKGLTSNYDYYSEVYTTNPSTGSAWTIAQVDALEAGMKSYSSKYGGRIAQVYAVVDYSTLNTCFDTDGGYALTIFGEVSGYLNQSYYSYSDYCTSNTTIVEYYCSGGYSYSWGSSCANGMTSICSNGACI